MAGRHGIVGKTKYHIYSYLELRKEGKEDKYLRSALRSWLGSVAAELTEEELRLLLIELYHNIRPNTNAVEILSNTNIIEFNVIKPNGLTFRNR